MKHKIPTILIKYNKWFTPNNSPKHKFHNTKKNPKKSPNSQSMNNINRIKTLISWVSLYCIIQELHKQQLNKINQLKKLREIGTVSLGFTSISKWVPLRVLTKIFIFVGRVSAYRNLWIVRHLSDRDSRRRLLQIEKAEGEKRKTQTQVTVKQKSSLCPLYIGAGGWRAMIIWQRYRRYNLKAQWKYATSSTGTSLFASSAPVWIG